MKSIGLTGSIGSGKSTVAQLLARLGAEVIRADDLAREARAEVADAICARFPEACDGESGPDDRKLARIVFRDPQALRALEALIHPRVREKIASRLEALRARRDPPPLVVVELPLLFETGWNPGFDGVLVVTAPDALRARRVAARSGLNRSEFEARDRAQLSQEEKARRADWVIANDADLETLERRVRAWYEEVTVED